MTKDATTAPASVIRCAVYTRKSSEEGLDQDFNSLDAQRESAEAYIASQRSEGWVCLPERYDDGGFTGGNMDRPALARTRPTFPASDIERTGLVSPPCAALPHELRRRGVRLDTGCT
jgi:site-specific DNA recombinase